MFRGIPPVAQFTRLATDLTGPGNGNSKYYGSFWTVSSVPPHSYARDRILR